PGKKCHRRMRPASAKGPLMNSDLLERVRATLARSELLQAVASVCQDGGLRLALGEGPLRLLSREAIAQLERQGNSAGDWSRVRVAEGFEPERVWGSHFQGDVVLGRFTKQIELTEGQELPAGVYHSTVVDCVIGHDAVVRDIRFLANYVVGEGAILF